jgi:CBS domain-containing protein
MRSVLPQNPLYQQVNVDGTRWLLQALQGFEVEQFVYSGTMLVHAPAAPGEHIDEDRPIAPQWAYPRSKQFNGAAVRRLAMKVREAMSADVMLADPEQTIRDAARMMADFAVARGRREGLRTDRLKPSVMPGIRRISTSSLAS